jgi:hypothetical protein
MFGHDLGSFHFGRQLEEPLKLAVIDLEREDLHDRLFAIRFRQRPLALDDETTGLGADFDGIAFDARELDAHEEEIAAAKNIHGRLPARRIMKTLKLDARDMDGNLAKVALDLVEFAKRTFHAGSASRMVRQFLSRRPV